MNATYPGTDRTVFSPSDFGRDGASDVMAVDDRGTLSGQWGNATGASVSARAACALCSDPATPPAITRNDVMAVTSTGDLYLYRGNGLSCWASGGQKIGTGWNKCR